MEYSGESFDVAVIGAGHAGAEAALACARLGAKTVLFTLSLDGVCNLPCNPSIGGTAKGHLVRELDALGGEMGKAADAVTLQSRLLNRGKGPAVHSLRAQVDRVAYQRYMKQVLENQPLLLLKQGEVVDIRLGQDGSVASVVTHLGAVHQVKAVVVCTGTYLQSKIFVGDYTAESGPDGMHSSLQLAASLKRLGVKMRRFKTGTPARVRRDSIDLQRLEEQRGDDPVLPFSFETTTMLENKMVCHIAYTNQKTHEIIKDNIHRSAMYGGEIVGAGARYCPSIEDKVVRFGDKPRHQIFVEPMGEDTQEMYLQGVSTSLPEDVQLAMYRSIEGFENIQIMRNAYAIEYACTDPIQLMPTLEYQAIPGLFGAGQFNGTSGYEEAAVQGFVAGVNAAHSSLGREPFVLERASSYIGTLIDDLVTKGCTDPYRMMTSRSEFRLVLRQDNADQRLTPKGRELGLISDERWEMFHVKQLQIQEERKRVGAKSISPTARLNAMLEERGTTSILTGTKLCELLRRPQLDYNCLEPFDNERPNLPADVQEQVEIGIKYEGYIKKQMAQVREMQRLEDLQLPLDINYDDLQGLRLEAREKLRKVQPRSIAQASRISGVSPADISVLLIVLKQMEGDKGDTN